MALPRQLSLHKDYLTDHSSKKGFRNFFSPLEIKPPASLETLRFNPVELASIDLAANTEIVIPEVKGKAMEIEAVINPKNAREVELRVLRSPDGKEQTKIRFFMQGWQRNKNARALSIDVSEASLSPDVLARPPETGLLYLEDNELLRLRVFIDQSIIEVFANDRQCLTIRAYPTREDSSGISLLARGSKAKLVSLKAWQMRSIWPELKSREGN
jgi:beta-fructofuranosidase